MQYAKLGSTGLLVSRLSLGAMTFTKDNTDPRFAAYYKVNAKLADEMVGLARDHSINFFDTADGYSDGQSEELLGATLRHRRHEVVTLPRWGSVRAPGLWTRDSAAAISRSRWKKV